MDDPAGADKTVFSALITPHRSLDRASFAVVMTLMCLASVVSGLAFVFLGAWPVAGFFGLDLVALSIAFRINFRDGRAFEEVLLTPVQLLLRQVSPHGQAREWRFNPRWTRLDRQTHPEFGVMRLTLISRGERVSIGQALSAAERAAFAEALGRALAKATTGG